MRVPEGWRETTLGNVSCHVTSKWEPTVGGQHTYLGLEHLEQGTGRILQTAESDDLSSIKTKFQAGDVLFGKLRPTLRKTAHPDFDGICSTDIIVVRAKPDIDPSFLFYTLNRTDTFSHAIKSAAGTKMPRTSWALMSGFTFHLPPLPEQRRIAEILSSVEEAIAATQMVIEQTGTVKQGTLNRLLTEGIGHTRFKQTEIGMLPEAWEVVTVDDICQRISVGIVVQPAQYYVPEGVKCFRSANVREGRVEDSNWVYISPEANKQLAKSRLEAGDVLVVRSGYTGTSCVVAPEFAGANCIDIIFARPNQKEVNPHFLSALINSPIGREQVLRSEGGMAQKHFNVSAMKKMLVPLPSMVEQEVISSRIIELNAQLRLADAEISRLQRLKSALLSDLLTGRKRVTADALSPAE
ncbi:restriction endonuclease subunit S [Azospirillum aestuarii]|uniref:restriction endonuclease subunit S n=1 Tax=Azospirillum aestuarii TaxID=2802052 RepID=UPI004054CA2F